MRLMLSQGGASAFQHCNASIVGLSSAQLTLAHNLHIPLRSLIPHPAVSMYSVCAISETFCQCIVDACLIQVILKVNSLAVCKVNRMVVLACGALQGQSMGSASITSAMQTNVQLMEIQIKLVDALTQLQVQRTWLI